MLRVLAPPHQSYKLSNRLPLHEDSPEGECENGKGIT